MYGNFAYIYDKLMDDVNYIEWGDYIEKLFEKHGTDKPELVLDLGCGTGSLCIELAKRGYNMTGIDLSPDMLSCAGEKALAEGAEILFLNQDMREFELYGTEDAILCMMDSLNYLTEYADVVETFKLVDNYLNPDGIFIFDINTQYKLSQVLGDNVFYDMGDEISYIWQNEYDKEAGISGFDLTFFVKEGELYRKHEEFHEERAYSYDEIEQALNEAGLELLGKYHEFTLQKPKKNSERVFFVCKKKDL